MSQSFDATLTIELKRSSRLMAMLGAMHVGAFAIACVVPATAATRVALLISVVLSFGYALLRHGRLDHFNRRLPAALQPRIVDAVELDTTGNWSVRYAGSAQWHACVLRERWLHPWLVILRLRSEQARALSVLIAADAVAADDFRRLRARVRLQTAVA